MSKGVLRKIAIALAIALALTGNGAKKIETTEAEIAAEIAG